MFAWRADARASPVVDHTGRRYGERKINPSALGPVDFFEIEEIIVCHQTDLVDERPGNHHRGTRYEVDVFGSVRHVYRRHAVEKVHRRAEQPIQDTAKGLNDGRIRVETNLAA